MIIIRHRCNKRNLLEQTSSDFGIEIDIRSHEQDLILHHDPFCKGELFENWLLHYRHKMLILNVKEEGLEKKIISLMKKHSIQDFFFLDQSFPFLIRTAFENERRIAIRVSEYESIETALKLSGKVEWVWLDCFTMFPISKEENNLLKEFGFKLCIVSPELQGRSSEPEIKNFRDYLIKHDFLFDAVCTKVPHLWV